MPLLHVVGDIHGHLTELQLLLCSVGIVDPDDDWRGGQDTLVVLGDMVDRGPNSVGVLDFVMHLQEDARPHRGQVYAVLGNHEVQLLAALRLRDASRGNDGLRTFSGDWRRWGGILSDLEQLRPAHVRWLQQLPTMVRVGDDLLVHADATFYPMYGRTMEDVNAAVTDVLVCDGAYLGGPGFVFSTPITTGASTTGGVFTV